MRGMLPAIRPPSHLGLETQALWLGSGSRFRNAGPSRTSWLRLKFAWTSLTTHFGTKSSSLFWVLGRSTWFKEKALRLHGQPLARCRPPPSS